MSDLSLDVSIQEQDGEAHLIIAGEGYNLFNSIQSDIGRLGAYWYEPDNSKWHVNINLEKLDERMEEEVRADE